MDVTAPWADEQHRALDHALAEIEFLAERRAFHLAAKRFRQFQEVVLEHMAEEERAATCSPTVKAQHAELRVALEAVASSLSQGDYSDFCYGVTALGKLLTTHLRTEEQAAR